MPAQHRGCHVGRLFWGSPSRGEGSWKLTKSNRTVRKAAENTTRGSKAKLMGRGQTALSLPIPEALRWAEIPLQPATRSAFTGRCGLGYLQRTRLWIWRGPASRLQTKPVRSFQMAVAFHFGAHTDPQGTCFGRVWVKGAPGNSETILWGARVVAAGRGGAGSLSFSVGTVFLCAARQVTPGKARGEALCTSLCVASQLLGVLLGPCGGPTHPLSVLVPRTCFCS